MFFLGFVPVIHVLPLPLTLQYIASLFMLFVVCMDKRRYDIAPRPMIFLSLFSSLEGAVVLIALLKLIILSAVRHYGR